MPKSGARRFVFKVALLIAMTAMIFLLRSDTRAQYGSPGCDNDYQYCSQGCADQYGSGSDAYNNCVHGSGGCDTNYFSCWGNENPPMQQPQKPCPPCLAECDLYQQQCLADGVQTPSQCAYTTFRCKQRCNYYCVY
jgi:hypothetical protein